MTERSRPGPTSPSCCLDHERAAVARAAGRGVVHRPLGRAPPRRVRLSRLVRLRAPAGRRSRRLVVRAPRALSARGPAVANPGCYATAALLALAPSRDAIDPAPGRRRREVRRVRRGQRAEGELARGLRARERLAVPGRQRTSTRRRSSSSSAFPSASSRISCPSSAACSRPATCTATERRICAAARGRVRVDARPSRCARDGVMPDLSRVQAPTAPRVALYEDRATGPGDRHLRDRQPRQGRGRPGRPEREPRARPDETAGLRLTGCSYERHRRQGLRCERRVGAHQQAGPDLPSSRERLVRRRRDVHDEPRAGRAGRRSAVFPATAEPQAIVLNSGNANAATGAKGEADARATAAEAAKALGLAPEQVLSCRPGVIGQPLPIDRLLAGIGVAAQSFGRRRGGRCARRSSRPTRGRRQPVVTARASRSAAWRRARG